MNVLVDGEILLFGTVGNLGWFEDDGFTAMDVVNALAEVGRSKDITVRINSGGGIAAEGVAIFNALDSHRGNVKVVVESIAASAASIIAMAGDEVVMRSGASMMVHDPAAFTMGNSDDHAKGIEALETIASSMADIYAEKTGRSAEEVRAEMKAEIWMTARDAVAKGYADKVEKGKSKEPTAAFDYRLYAHAPERMVALAKSRGWQRPGATADEDSAAHNRQPMENTMTDAEKAAADKLAADKVAAETQAKIDEAVAAAKATATAEANKRAADIHAACQMVGKPDKATAFIAEGKTLSEVVAALQADRTAGEDVNARHSKAPGKGEPVSWDKAVDRVNARVK